ncbi:MAG: CvpA family protein [Phycisphaerae bacterium]|nr:CvpA family protein [Phycisphaerae bacterium]
MALNLFALLFVLGITFVHSIFGLYSGILNLACCVFALAVAFGYVDPLNDLLTGTLNLHPSYTEPLALVLLFIVTVFILRTLSDLFLRGNVRVPMYVDWIGGAACGFFVGQITIGVLIIGFLMLPWGGRALGYSRYERDPENRTYRDAELPPDEKMQDERVAFVRHHVWLRSDAFAAGLFKLLSNGSLRGPTTFASVYPDYPTWVFWSGNTVQPESLTAPIRDDKGDGFKNGLKVESWWEQTTPLTADDTRYRRLKPDKSNEKPPYEPIAYKVQPGNRLIGVRLTLERAAADRDKQSAYHRFRPSMIRLVGDVKLPDGTAEPQQYIPQMLGGVDSAIESKIRIVDLDNNFGMSGDKTATVDAYFEVKEGFQPRFLEYRRHARAALSDGQKAKSAPGDRLAAEAQGGTGRDRATGPARFIDTVNRGVTGDRDRLPFVMSIDKLRPISSVELAGTTLASARVDGDRAVFEVPEKEAEGNVARFKLPEGKRLFQLETKPRKAKSLPGQVMNFVGSVTNQYKAVDSSGESYDLVGYYAIVKKGDQTYFELVYVPDDPSFRQMLDFKDKSVRTLLQDQDDAVLGLIFAVPPGKDLVAVSSQGGRVEFETSFRMQSE